MGAWGTEPKENDGSCDLYYPVSDARDKGGLSAATVKVYEILNKSTPSYTDETNFKWELLGMFQLFLEDLDKCYQGSIDYEQFWKNTRVPEMLWKAHQFCQEVYNDQKWLSGWEERDEVQGHLKSFQKLLLAHVPKCCT